MPTRSALNHRLHHSQSGGFSVLDASGELVPEAQAIVEAIARSDCTLNTGHLRLRESVGLIDQAHRGCVRRISVTHPEWGPTLFPAYQQKELAKRGNVWFEWCFVSTTELCGRAPFRVIEQAIIEAGVETTVLSADLGQPQTPPPVEGLRLHAEQLLSSGFSREHVSEMMCANPAHLLLIKGVGKS